MTPSNERVLLYLFCEMVGFSKACTDDPELFTWYDDGLTAYEDILAAQRVEERLARVADQTT